MAKPSMPEPPPQPEAPDVAVTLEVGDFVDRLPPNFLNAGPFDRHHKIEFRASELYSDLTKGRASVPASTIYARYPAIFARPVTDTEDVEVSLPLAKACRAAQRGVPDALRSGGGRKRGRDRNSFPPGSQGRRRAAAHGCRHGGRGDPPGDPASPCPGGIRPFAGGDSSEFSRAPSTPHRPDFDDQRAQSSP